jgi:hypothetical protein
MDGTVSPVILNAAAKLRRSDKWLSTEHDGNVIMMDSENGRFLGLNATASLIWRLLDVPRTLGELGASLAEDYSVDAEQAVNDMRPLITDLLDQRALALAGIE